MFSGKYLGNLQAKTEKSPPQKNIFPIKKNIFKAVLSFIFGSIRISGLYIHFYFQKPVKDIYPLKKLFPSSNRKMLIYEINRVFRCHT